MLKRSAHKLSQKIQNRPARTKYIAITEATSFSLQTFPKEAKLMLDRIIPIYEQTRQLPKTDLNRWLHMLHRIPEDVLVDYPNFRESKPKQAAYVTVMLAVYARTLLHATDEDGLRCDMSDDEIHLATNRIYLFYFPAELYRRRGFIEVNMPADPFGVWTELSISYTEKGIEHKSELEFFPPAEDVEAGKPVAVPFEEWAKD